MNCLEIALQLIYSFKLVKIEGRMNLLREQPFEFLISTVGQYIVDIWRRSTHIERHLDNLRGALSRGHELIRRSECWCLRYELVDKYLSQLKNAVYEAECVVDELEYQRLKQKVENSWPGEVLTDYFKSWMSGFPEKVKMVQENLYKLCNDMDEICNKLQIPENHNQFSETARPITTRFCDTTNLYGRDEELNDVIHSLGIPRSGSGGKKRTWEHNLSALPIGESSSTREKKGNVRIISIVGLGGVGKTSLAQLVYNDTRVKTHFENLIWVCVSESFDVWRLTKEITECVTNMSYESYNYTNLNMIQEMLAEKIKSMKFLLVLDDAWSEKETDWQRLLGPIRGGLEGSAVLVTTRSQKVADVASNGLNSVGAIYLNGLEEKIYWDFFKSCAFGLEVRTESYPELEEIGKQICKKLKGSPLAAKTIGGLLKINLDAAHWSNIRDSKMWQLRQEEHDILPVLQLSYQYLPSHLKKCFSYCSLYPKHFEFTKTELAKLWKVQGFINQETPQQVQDFLVEVYFNEWVSRCFFQQAGENHSDKYVIHDLMHDVCQSITKGECLCLEEDSQEIVSFNIRHLSVYELRDHRIKLNELIKYKKLISLSILHISRYRNAMIEIWCNNLTSIRSLSLVRYHNLELPESIENLKHLQYLDVSFSGIIKLPKSFCSLYSLKYLNMEGCSIFSKVYSFPEGIEKLVSLQIFYFPEQGIRLEGIVNYHAEKIIVKNLRFFLRYGGTIVDKIANLKHISIRGSLHITNLETVPTKEAAEEADLNKKPLIDRLKLCWSVSNEHHSAEEVLEGLCPHPNLKELTIGCYGGQHLSPRWLKEEFLPNLTELVIMACPNFSTISHLPHCIAKLEISNCSQLTHLENCLRPVHLPLLKRLVVECCEQLVSLAVESFEGFISLEELTIADCPRLSCQNEMMVLPTSLKHLHLASCGDLANSIPACLRNLTSLIELKLSSCPYLVSVPAEVTCALKLLSVLDVRDCAELESLGGLEFLASLQKLNIERCSKLEETGGQDINEELPSELVAHLPSSSRRTRRATARRARY